jgi:plasmid stabilization system protein ParE
MRACAKWPTNAVRMSQQYSPKPWRYWIPSSISPGRMSVKIDGGWMPSCKHVRPFRSATSRHGLQTGGRRTNYLARRRTRSVEDVERLRSFLDQNNPGAARRSLVSIWTAIDRLQEFPDLGTSTADTGFRQLVVHFGASGYIVRYTVLPPDILITRIWHGREARP